MAKKRKTPSYIRLAQFRVEEVLPFVFTREVRKQLRRNGFGYNSPEWKAAASHRFWYAPNKSIVVAMGSHRYQLFAEKGCVCVNCDLPGTYFVLERGFNDHKKKFHFNLYGRTRRGKEVMLTKDHIHPRSKGGKNRLENYQTMCIHCNRRKSDHLVMPDA